MTIGLTLELELQDAGLLNEIFGSAHPGAGSTGETSAPAARWTLVDVEEGVGFLESVTATILVTVVSPIAINLLSNALYDRIAARTRRMRIDGRSVRVRPEEIEQALRAIVRQREQIEEGSGDSPSEQG